MLLKASPSISSIGIVKALPDDCVVHAAASDIISASNDESQQETPRVNNTRAFSRPISDLEAASNETIALLRVNVLYLEGIASPSIPSARISVWVGFRSSFPPDSMTVQSSSYSSYFLKEGNLLAIESDQVKWTPGMQDDTDQNKHKYSSFYHGVAFWDSLYSGRSPHLEIAIPTLPAHVNEHQPLLLPDILEFHLCLVYETVSDSPENDSSTSINSTWKRLNSSTHSSMSLNKWDDPMEEEHWYKDDSDDTSIFDEFNITQMSQEQQLQHGVAHLKLSRDPESTDNLDFSGKILRLPIRIIQPLKRRNERVKEGVENDVTFLQNASLSIQVEKISVPANIKSKHSVDDQQHYVISTWNGGNELLPNHAPHSVKCDDEYSQENEQNNVSSTRHFHFRKMKSIIPQSMSKSGKIVNPQQVTHDTLPVDQEILKIHQALQSSIKAMSDRKGLAAALRYQRETTPVSPRTSNIFGDENGGVLKVTLFDEVLPDDKLDSVCSNVKAIAVNECVNSCRLLNTDRTQSSAHLLNSESTSLPKQQQERGEVTTTRKVSIIRRLFCGAPIEFAEVIHHCDEDNVGIYTMDSQSFDSSVST